MRLKVGDTEWELVPLKGLKAIRMMPKVIGVLSHIFYSVIGAGVPLDEWFNSGEIKLGDLLKLFNYASLALGDNIDVLTNEIMPFLMQVDPVFLQNNGTPDEILRAFWDACKYHYNSSFGEDVREALKNFLRPRTEEAQVPPMSSTK